MKNLGKMKTLFFTRLIVPLVIGVGGIFPVATAQDLTGTNPAAISANDIKKSPSSTSQDTLSAAVVSVDKNRPLDARERRAYEKYAKRKSCKKCAHKGFCKKCADKKKRAAQKIQQEKAEKDGTRTQSRRARRRRLSASERAIYAYGQILPRPDLAYLHPYVSAGVACAHHSHAACRRHGSNIPRLHRPHGHGHSHD